MSRLGDLIDHRVLGPARAMKASAFDELTIAPSAIVFLGDSLTEGGAWHEWFPKAPVVNRGIGGDTAAGVLCRLGSALGVAPAAVFVLIGTNDLGRRRPVDDIVQDVDAIVSRIREHSLPTRVVLQSVLPRQPRYRDRIHELNVRYAEIAWRHGVVLLDLWPAFADKSGGLRSTYTLDRLHLNGRGYRAWVDLLRPCVAAVVKGR